jgi:hypothetical protein
MGMRNAECGKKRRWKEIRIKEIAKSKGHGANGFDGDSGMRISD